MKRILYFSAPWCSMCKLTSPSLLSATSYYHTVFENINCDDEKNEHLTKKYDIMSLPTIIILDEDGDVVYRSSGAKSVEGLIADLEPYFKE